MKSLIVSKKSVIGIIISFICVYFAFRGVSWNIVIDSVKLVKFSYLLYVTIIYIFGYIIRAIRWKLLLSGVVQTGFKNLFPHLMIGFFLNNILPMRIGEFARAYTSGKKLGISKTASFASIVLERTFDGICFLILVVISFQFIPFPRWMLHGSLAASIFFIGILGILLFFSFYENRSRQIIDLMPLPRAAKNTITGLMNNFVAGLKSLHRLKTVVLIAGTSVLIWSCELTCFYLMSKAFNLNISFVHIIFVSMCLVLGVMVPAAPGYIGTFEIAGKKALEILGHDPAIAISFILFLHIFQMIIVNTLGFPSLLLQHISIKEIRDSS